MAHQQTRKVSDPSDLNPSSIHHLSPVLVFKPWRMAPQDRQKKLLKFARSKVHAWGIFARAPIKADETVVEYVGEVIRREVR